jgi:hypothetical protein
VAGWLELSGRRRSPGILGIGVAAALGCTLVLERQGGQCSVHADCQVLDPRYVCSEGGVCVLSQTRERELPRPAGDECQRDLDCANGLVAAVCRDGFCEALEGVDRRCIVLGSTISALADGPNVMLIGLLSSSAELGQTEPSNLADAHQPGTGIATTVATALAELNRVRRAERLTVLPPLVAVACNEGDPEALEYLLDTLRVRYIIGPTSSERVELALLRVGERALLLPPFADGPNLEPGASDPAGYLLSCRPNRRAIQAYFLDAVSEARSYIADVVPGGASLDPALLVSTDVATARFAEGIDEGAMAALGVRRFRYGDMTGRDLASVLRGVEPPVDLVIAASMEDDWSANMSRYDAEYFGAHGTFPYYFLADKRAWMSGYDAQSWEQTVADTETSPPPYLRFLGLDHERSSLSQLAQADFTSGYLRATGHAPEPALEYAYDCTYLAVYAAIAAGLRLRRPVLDLEPQAIVTGLPALQGGTPALLAGGRDVADVISSLLAGGGLDGSLDLVGASGELDFQIAGADALTTADSVRRYFSVTPPNGEIYCVDANSKSLCDTGIVFSTRGGAPLRSGDACACLRTR